ncbi:antitoxin YefM [Akkermansia muciniphila]|nr:antitoxin YefM [Akkermansia muciniphila]
MYTSFMNTISSTAARQSISKTLAAVLNDREPVRIVNKRLGAVIIMPEDEFNSWQETIYLLKCPANARRLLDGVEALNRRQGTVTKTVEELENHSC